MVAAAGIGKAATAVADKATTTTAKGASKEQVGRFDKAMQERPGQGNAAASSAASPANQAGAVAGNAVQPGVAPPSTAANAAGGTPGGGPGDRILRGIDKMRTTAKHLVDGAPAASATPSSAETGGTSPLGNVSDMMDTQKSLIGFEVETQVGGKGVQETNQAVQTLLKGQ